MKDFQAISNARTPRFETLEIRALLDAAGFVEAGVVMNQDVAPEVVVGDVRSTVGDDPIDVGALDGGDNTGGDVGGDVGGETGGETGGQTGERVRLDTPNVTITEVTATSVEFSWEPVEGAIRYLVGYRLDGAEAYTVVKNVENTSIKIEGLDAFATYDFRVKAIADQDVAINSQFNKFTVPTKNYVRLDTPEIAVAVENNVVNVSWLPVNNALRYIVGYKSDSALEEEYIVIKNIADTSVSIEGLRPDLYNIRVKAVADNVVYSNSQFAKYDAYVAGPPQEGGDSNGGGEELEDVEFDLNVLAGALL